jgi:hypothetical protein
MAVLGSVIQPSVLSVLDARHDLSLGRAIAGQLVGDHHPRSDALLLQQLAQQALGGFGIPAALDQDVEHNAMLIDGTPQPMLLARDANDNLVEVPLVSGCRKTGADPVCKALPELQRPPTVS